MFIVQTNYLPQALIEQVLPAVRICAPLADSYLHGERHWCAVAQAGARLCAATPAADPVVVRLFALFHDAARRDEGTDRGHGRRALPLVHQLATPLLSAGQLELLVSAIAEHETPTVSDNSTIGVCWDSDRLNLWRVGFSPDPRYLSSRAALGLIDWASDLHSRVVGWE